jgi:hypothetical protein
MPLAPATVQREAVLSGSAVGVIQRAETESTPTSNAPAPSEPPKLNYDEVAEKVFPHIRRWLRVERERERGLPS